MDTQKIRKYLGIGLAGAIITLAGELIEGLAESVEVDTNLAAMVAPFSTLPAWRLGLGSTLGAVGILLQFFGVMAIYLGFRNKDDGQARRYKAGVYNYVFVGAVIHVLLTCAMYVYKLDHGAVGEFMTWFCAPLLALFFVGYIWFSVIMFARIAKGATVFPRWCCVLNPLIGKLIFSVPEEFIPRTSPVLDIVCNGVSNANMGITAVIMFLVLLLVKYSESEDGVVQ